MKGEYADMKLCRTAVNFITLLRMIGTMGLLFLRPMSPQFLTIYLLTGITDVLDGWLARKTGTASEFGARLDSIADLLFYAVMLIRIFPVLWERLPVQIWYAVAGILLFRHHPHSGTAERRQKGCRSAHAAGGFLPAQREDGQTHGISGRRDGNVGGLHGVNVLSLSRTAVRI